MFNIHCLGKDMVNTVLHVFYTTLLWLSIFDSVGLITLTFTKAPFLPNIKQREFALILFKQTWRGSHYGNESRTMSSFLQTILTSVMQKQ